MLFYEEGARWTGREGAAASLFPLLLQVRGAHLVSAGHGFERFCTFWLPTWVVNSSARFEVKSRSSVFLKVGEKSVASSEAQERLCVRVDVCTIQCCAAPILRKGDQT